LTACAVDLRLRSRPFRPFALDSIVAKLAKQFLGQKNNYYSDLELFKTSENMCGDFLKDFIDSCLNIRNKIILPELLTEFGIALEKVPNGKPEFGAKFNSRIDFTINHIDHGSSAEKGGLAINDIVISVDGQTFENVTEMGYYIDSRKVGKTIKVEVERDGRLLNRKVKLRGTDTYSINKMKNPSAEQQKRWRDLIS